MATIVTPRPPLNIFDRARLDLDDTWQTIYETPDYQIPAQGPNPSRTVEAVALLTSLIVANTDDETIQVSVRLTQGGAQTYTVITDLPVPINDFALIELGKQNMPSGDVMEIKVNTDQTATAHLSYVLNQREEFTVV